MNVDIVNQMKNYQTTENRTKDSIFDIKRDEMTDDLNSPDPDAVNRDQGLDHDNGEEIEELIDEDSKSKAMSP